MNLDTINSPVNPGHVAVIMDGNNRWATKRNIPGAEGHRAGVAALRELVRYCSELDDVHVLTAFAFSSENWSRSDEEVNAIMGLMLQALVNELPELNENGVRMHIVGDKSRLSEGLIQRIDDAEKVTRQNDKMHLVIAINYGGRWDIVNAAKKLAIDVQSGELTPTEINEEQLAGCLSLSQFPDPDLLIRTGGEHRISNFLLWQSAYSELYFSDALWPDYDRAEFDVALESYRSRQRRYGGRVE
ncbi:MAG: di-trans,poly-cis-decaprenylcistransferase [Gammaproteobacteria bacterium]|nr:di-trans,poly-cis-decaprenylcistransferase [Gammaproteobacteria bacterium]